MMRDMIDIIYYYSSTINFIYTEMLFVYNIIYLYYVYP